MRRAPDPRGDAVRELQRPQNRRGGVEADLYAPTADAALMELEAFAASDLGRRYPASVQAWERAWDRFTPFLEFPPAVRKIIYTTDEIVKREHGNRRVFSAASARRGSGRRVRPARRRLVPRCVVVCCCMRRRAGGGCRAATVRSWRAAGGPGGLDQDPADLRPAGFADPAVHRGGAAGLADFRVQPDIGNELVRVIEPGKVTDGGHDRDRRDRIDTRNCHQPCNDGIAEGLDGQFPVHGRELAAVEVQLPQQRVHGRALVGGQVLA